VAKPLNPAKRPYLVIFCQYCRVPGSAVIVFDKGLQETMKNTLLALACLACSSVLVPVPAPAQNGVQAVYISPMIGNLDGFIAAEIIKQHVPMRVVLAESDAEFVITGLSLREDDKWYNFAFGGKDKNEGNIRLIDVKHKTMVWAGEAGDRTLWYGSLHRGGQRKVAQRLVGRMKRDSFTLGGSHF
jgi:hypothetical protein